MSKELVELIKCAVNDEPSQKDELFKKVQPRIRAYILRCTLNEDLTEDILQETMLQMLISLKTLNEPQRFWPWLYKIASNKIVSHFRKNRHCSSIQFSAMEDHLLESALQDHSENTADVPAMRELHTLVLKTMEKLTPPQRSVLSLRCFDGMQYQEIAEAVGCSESTARVQFLRARKRLKSSLTKQGLSRKAILPALVLFGKLTAGQDALAASITTSTVTFETGLTTTEVITAAVKTYFLKFAAVTATTAATVFLGHTAWVQTHPHPYPQRQEVQSVHYTVQGVGLLDEENRPVDTGSSSKEDVDSGPYYCKGAYEQWLQFPEGPDGPVLVRMQRWGLDPQTHENTDKLCGWLQNGQANYYYNSGGNEIYITNDPIGMLILPTDTPEMVDFLIRYSDYQDNIKYSKDRKTGLLKAKNDNRVPSVKNYKTEYVYNNLSNQDFEPFWPKNAGVIDDRDPMHRRGWTYLIFEGNLGNLQIKGKGRLPFSYSASQENSPWLDIQIGDSIHIMDTSRGACLINEDSGEIEWFVPGTFFTGLGRPWIGIRAYDTLRRDAAIYRIPFQAERKGEIATVDLKQELGPETYNIRYSIDMAKDIINSIDFAHEGTHPAKGRLEFTYAQTLEDWPTILEEPDLPFSMPSENQSKSRHWILALLENSENPFSGKTLANQAEY